MSEDILDFYLPNAHNCIQSAIYQISVGNTDLALQFLRNAQNSLAQAKEQPCR